MIKTVACLLLLLLLQPTLARNAVGLDLFSGHCHERHWWGGCKKYVEDHSRCTFWIKNGNTFGSTRGLSGRSGRIGLNGRLSGYHPTYIWTTCSDDLWIDRMVVETNVHERLIYGQNNNQGWCLSYNQKPGARWMLNYIPAKRCYKMFKLGRVTARDTRVWGYNKHKRSPGRRALTADDIQEVKNCEDSASDVEKECLPLVKKFFETSEADEEGWTLVQTIEETAELFKRFVKDANGEVDRSVMLRLLMEVSTGTENDADVLFGLADENNNGALDFSEFKTMLGFEDDMVNLANFQELLRISNQPGLINIQ